MDGRADSRVRVRVCVPAGISIPANIGRRRALRVSRMNACMIVPLVAIANSVEIGLPVTFALAAVALIGYLFGNRTRSTQARAFDERRQQEFDRAARIA